MDNVSNLADLAEMTPEQMTLMSKSIEQTLRPGYMSAEYGPTEESLGREWVIINGNAWRYDHEIGCWFHWDGNRWRLDKVGFAGHLIGLHLRDAARISAQRWLGRYNTTRGVEQFARQNPVIAVTHNRWDQDTMLLGTPSGIIDLHSGTIRESTPEDYITKSASITPEPGQPVLWLRFLNEVFAEDQELVAFIQRICGYCLTGETKEHALAFLYGEGGNGKSVFLNTISGILGDYAEVAAMETFMGSSQPRHSTDLAALCGARLVTASETEQGRGWDEAKLKALTGGDPITARFMRQDNFTYSPQFKLIIAGNHAPTLRQVDEAIRRRLLIVPFTSKPRKPDHDLEQKLKQEWPKILNWMVTGALEWQKFGLCPPASVCEMTNQYFADQDVFSQWLEECCILDPSAREKPTPLFESWREYARNACIDSGTPKDFKANLERKGIRGSSSNGDRIYRGISLIETRA